jgi:predicted TIM-barrel fold metal-dependent hydrolase
MTEVADWTRRGVMGAGLALTASSAMAMWTKLDFAVPDGACDCHHHIYDPRFPYLPAQAKRGPATVADYRIFQRRMKTSRDVIVLPSAYGTNSDPLLFFEGQMGDVTRSIAVMHADVSDTQLKDLNAVGVRGVRIQFGRNFSGFFKREEILPIAKRVAAMGWHVQFHMPGPLLAELGPVLLSLPATVVIDHMGHAQNIHQPQYKTVRKLLDTGHGWIKLSGVEMGSKAGPPHYTDTAAVMRSYIEAAPERVVWGSNWPFPGEHPQPDIVILLNVLAAQAGSAKTIQQILVENPEKLYGFDPAKRPKAT